MKGPRPKTGAAPLSGIAILDRSPRTPPTSTATRRRRHAAEGSGNIARSRRAPVTVETIVVPDPGRGNAVVTIHACGVCHTDRRYREGAINNEIPFLLCHGAAGIRE